MTRAIMCTCRADVAAIEDQAIIDIFPIFFRNQTFEVVRYFFQIGVIAQIKSVCESLHMCVGWNSFPDIVELSQNHVGSFVGNARQCGKLGNSLRDAGAKIVSDDFGGGSYRLRFISKKGHR